MQDNTALPAPTASATTTVAPGKDEFVKVEGGGPERTSAEGSVVLAYSLMWAIMVTFVWRTLKAQAALSVQTDDLMRAIEKGSR
jgi:hypothetical protein